MQIHVGCSGWFYSHWRGIFYPRQEVTTKNWFGYYANVFRTVELNAPFYRWPKPATIRRWKRDAPPGFIYTVKVNQLITHERRMVRTKKLVQDFYTMVPVLGEKMGCFLFQFPPSYRYTASRLQSIVRQLDPTYRNAVEFRHRSWWRERVYRELADHDITFAAVSAPRLPETLPPNPRRLYVRFSGRTQWYRHDYSRAELQSWADRIHASGAEEAWIYFNNDREGHAIKNALMLRRILRNMDAATQPAAVSVALTLIRPMLVAHRQAIEGRPHASPPGHKCVHQSDKPGIVRGLQQMGHLVHKKLIADSRRRQSVT